MQEKSTSFQTSFLAYDVTIQYGWSDYPGALNIKCFPSYNVPYVWNIYRIQIVFQNIFKQREIHIIERNLREHMIQKVCFFKLKFNLGSNKEI